MLGIFVPEKRQESPLVNSSASRSTKVDLSVLFLSSRRRLSLWNVKIYGVQMHIVYFRAD